MLGQDGMFVVSDENRATPLDPARESSHSKLRENRGGGGDMIVVSPAGQQLDFAQTATSWGSLVARQSFSGILAFSVCR
jgi:hypothetical protein